MHKKSLTERDICTKFITPALKNAGWDIQKQIREVAFFINVEQKIETYQTTQKHWMKIWFWEAVELRISDEFHLNIAAEPIVRYKNNEHLEQKCKPTD